MKRSVFIKVFFVLGSCFAFFVLYLLVERNIINQRIRSIPLRICVTGTRGKSSVIRLIAASLSEAGFEVLAKTTGSRPIIIFPDGREEEIKRGEVPSILEEKKLLKLGAKLKIGALVLELMGIHPESVYAESVQILRPHILVMTNVRLDHLAQMGSSKEDTARSIASSIPEISTVFVPQQEFFPVFQKTAEKLRSKVIQVSGDSFQEYFRSNKKFPFFELEENMRLALAVAEFLGIDREVAFQGMAKARPDFGSLKVWTAELDSPPRRFDFVSIFAANDPESTRLVLSNLSKKRIFEGKNILGLLNFRKDRGDRTFQWLKAFKERAFPEISKFYLIGFHSFAFKRKLDLLDKAYIVVVKEQAPGKIIQHILADVKGEAVLVGMGNMGGMGKELVHYWDDIGKPYDL